MKLILLSTIAVALSTVLAITSVSAAGKGRITNAKPFATINDRLDELEGAITSQQDQINHLVARVDTVEQRVIANEDTISILHDRNRVLDSLIQQNLTDMASVETEIALLQQSNTDLNAMIANNSGDIEKLQHTVVLNEGFIKDLRNATLQVLEGSITFETSFLKQIGNNLALIQALQKEVNIINEKLELKQNLVTGTCPDGSAIQEIMEDGSVACGRDYRPSGQLETIRVIRRSIYIPTGSTIMMQVRCPDTFSATDAGFSSAMGWELTYIYTDTSWDQTGNAGFIIANNNNPFEDFIYATATCARIAP